GGIFQDATGNIVALSCNHVLSNENNCRIGDFIFQPGMADAPGTPTIFTGWDKIPNTPYFANLTAYSTLTTPQKNEQDSAIATIYPDFVSRGFVVSTYPNGKPMSGIGIPVVGTEVQKF